MRVDWKTLRKATIELSRLWYVSKAGPAIEDKQALIVSDGSRLCLVMHHKEDVTTLIYQIPGKGNALHGCVDVRSLKQVVAQMKGVFTTLHQDGEHLVLEGGRDVCMTLPLKPPQDYPSEYLSTNDEPEWSEHAVWDVAKTREALEHVVVAVSRDESRPFLNAVGIEPTALVGTNGHRMHLSKFDGQLKESLLPLAGAVTLLRLMTLTTGPVLNVFRGGRKLRFSCAPWELTVVEGKGRFLPYDKVIPHHRERSVSVDGKLLRAALKAVARGTSVQMTLNGAMQLESYDENLNAHTAKLPLLKECDTELLIGFNASYLYDAVNTKSDTVTLQLNGPSDAVMIEDQDRMAVVMPMRI
jgi:DNA polymerase III sliding clamp (beta) subunit (PCNA family)